MDPNNNTKFKNVDINQRRKIPTSHFTKLPFYIDSTHPYFKSNYTQRKCKQILCKAYTCGSVSFCTMVSFLTLMLRFDKVSVSSLMVHPIKLATVDKPEKKQIQHVSNLPAG